MVESKFVNELTARVEARRRDSIRTGILITMKRLFGASPMHEGMIGQIDDFGRLDRMQSALIDVTSWDALLKIQ